MALRWKLMAGVAAAAVAVPAAVTAASRTKTEEPRYEVVDSERGFEVRQYSPRIVAEVDVTHDDPRKADSAGFRILADYIFGNNKPNAKIAMTAPVDRAPSEKIAMTAPVDRAKAKPRQDEGNKGKKSEKDRWTITFTMPSKYTLKTLPKPVDPRVRIREVPPKRYAVMRFSGAPGEGTVAKRMRWLVEAVEQAGLERTGAEPSYARYDPPWTLPPLRRNEIFVELRTPESDKE